MGWHITEDLDEYLAAAGDFLWADPTLHTVELGVIEALRVHGTDLYGGEPALFGWWRAGTGPVSGALLRTRPYPALLSGVPPAAAGDLAEILADQRRTLAGVVAERPVAHGFARTWRRRTGTTAKETRRQRLYRLERLDMPSPPPPGAARIAGPADLDLVTAWHRAFGAEAHEGGARIPARLIEDKIAYGGVALWEADGVPVSMAARTPLVSGMARVAPVYTPSEHRRRGYGAAVTAALTRWTLDAGARDVVLFTDLANPTSNAIYRRIGYRPVIDRLELSFHRDGPSPETSTETSLPPEDFHGDGH
ncbi:Predicted acetyltransferase, GNAT family [Thermomonospora echinospora]|uniref:Predicted acetyltransferase, GNAT family n=1 Tax=Thermomonospora echinospora TaxID=1992 RepID=A0A1H5V9K9_9ACTN|nr:GNAT family N-acetyltransferase [Thermomonospora echinospora]SEF84019.1 Predicted acetyltransferase, GNAT family [Thermomonospora echinospora]